MADPVTEDFGLPSIDVSHEWILEAHQRTLSWISQIHRDTCNALSTVIVQLEESDED